MNERLKEVGLSYNGPVKVRHYMRLLWEEVGLEAIKTTVTRPLTDVILAPHYGCHYLKPSVDSGLRFSGGSQDTR